jgi:hypothetical protein
VGEGDDIVAQLAIGEASFWVSPDAMFGQAVAAGASPAGEMADEHGWRVGRIIDPFGHEWEIGRPRVPGRRTDRWSRDVVPPEFKTLSQIMGCGCPR